MQKIFISKFHPYERKNFLLFGISPESCYNDSYYYYEILWEVPMHSLWLILSSVFFGVAGVYFFLKPEMAMEMAAIYAGVAIFMSGISQLMRHLTTSAENRSLLRLIMAGVDILFGLWLLSSGNWRWLILFMPYMFTAYILMRSGMLLTFYAKNRAQIPSPHMYLLAAVGQILVGGAMFMMPLFAMKLFIYVAGLGLLWCGFTNFTAWREMQEQN